MSREPFEPEADDWDKLLASGDVRRGSQPEAPALVDAPKKVSFQEEVEPKEDDAIIHLVAVDPSKSASDPDVPPAAAEEDKENLTPYAFHPVTLSFYDEDLERAFVHFTYVEGGCIGGKLYSMMAVVLMVGLFIFFNEDGWPSVNQLKNSYWIVHYSAGIIWAIVLAAAMWVEPIHAYREYILMFIIATHWPAFQMMNMTVRDPQNYSYCYPTTCYFFCTFISQPRIKRIFPFLTLTPGITLFCVSFFTSYWDTHSHLEIVLWPLMLFPLSLLHVFERSTRKAFIRIRQSQHTIDSLETRIRMTQSIIARFFAPTPTYNLLVTKGNCLAKSYQNAGMVVTDIAGFTAWTSKTQPETVISMLTGMFQSIDLVSDAHGVEKIATIGDAFVGVTFGRFDAAGEKDAPIRLANAARFCVTILQFAGMGLKMRVGLHCGTVLCGCFGSSPPKFDLMSDDFELAKTLESEGHPGKVHMSEEALLKASSFGQPVNPEATPYGAVFEIWEEFLDKDTETLELILGAGPDPENDGNLQDPYIAKLQDNAIAVCELLCALAENPLERKKTTVKEAINKRLAGTAEDPLSTSTTMGQTFGLDRPENQPVEMEVSENTMITASALIKAMNEAEAKVHCEEDNDQEKLEAERIAALQLQEEENEIIEEKLYFNPLLLEFSNDAVETRYQMTVRRTNLTQFACQMFIYMILALFVAQILLCCIDSNQNRLVSGASAVIIASQFAFLQWVGTDKAYALPVVYATYFSLAVLPALALRSDCNAHPQQDQVTGNVIMLYYLLWSLIPQFFLSLRLKFRIVIYLVTDSILVLLIFLRHHVIFKDDVLVWDWWVLLNPGAGVFVSFFADFTLRRVFQGQMRLRMILDSTKGKSAEVATRAVDVMLPQFVTKRMMSEGKKDRRRKSSDMDSESDSATQLSQTTFNIMELGGKPLLWEYRAVCVMFIQFNLNESINAASARATDAKNTAAEFLAINQTVIDIERILYDQDIQKVKTIGSMIMAAAGVGDVAQKGRAIEDNIAACIEGALLVERLFSSNGVTSFRVGIHAGPVFGAVLGDKGLVFDLFGDTVNTASRVMSSAPNKMVRVSQSARSRLLGTPGLPFALHPCEPVTVKGKGQLIVFNATWPDRALDASSRPQDQEGLLVPHAGTDDIFDQPVSNF